MESCWRSRQAAIPTLEVETTQEPSIYRHVFEIELAGKYPDTLRLVMSSLSTRKEWIGI